MTVTVVGIGADGWDGLTPRAIRAISASKVILGSVRQLALVDDSVAAERVPWPTPLLPALPDLLEHYAAQGLCVLASGDPMFHGIGVTLARLLGADELMVIPQPSSTSLACARLGWPVATTPTVSVVTRPVETVLAHVSDGACLLVLSRHAGTPAQIAAVLAAHGWGKSRLTVLEQLGGPRERVYSGTAAGWTYPAGDALNVVALECVADAGAQRLSRVPGLPDSVYASDGQLTKQEARALTLSALAPTPGELLWDVGAGSGSIGIEWLRVHSTCRAVAFEHHTARAERIAGNAAALGVPQLEVRGEAPAAFVDVPTPDAVFVGGGLTAAGLLDACWEGLRPGGRLVVNSVTLESDSLLAQWHGRIGGTLRRLQVHRAEPLGSMTTWRPQLPITQLVATK